MSPALLYWLLFAGQIVTYAILFILLLKNYREEKEPQNNSLQDELKKTKAAYTELDSEFKGKLSGKEEELKKIFSRNSTMEVELKKKDEDLQFLKKENKEITAKLKDLEARIKKYDQEIEAQAKIIAEYKNKEELKNQISKLEAAKQKKPADPARAQKEQNIGEILLKHKLIANDILDKALKYQQEYGRNITQYLLGLGLIDEQQLAQCLCYEFAIPYLPLSSYNIRDEIIQLIPADIAEKYWLVPVEKAGDLLTVVMADPLDAKAIKKIEEITGCTVQPFVSTLSEVIEALEAYYRVIINNKGSQAKKTVPFFIDTETYKGLDRRQAVRFKCKIDVAFPQEGYYKKSKTIDLSRLGFLLESESPLLIGSLITLQINLPEQVSHLPIAAIVQVLRVSAFENNKFGIGVKIIKISEQELNIILKYAASSSRDQKTEAVLPSFP